MRFDAWPTRSPIVIGVVLVLVLNLQTSGPCAAGIQQRQEGLYGPGWLRLLRLRTLIFHRKQERCCNAPQSDAEHAYPVPLSINSTKHMVDISLLSQ